MVSGLALNFVPDPRRGAAELARVASPGGVVAAYAPEHRATELLDQGRSGRPDDRGWEGLHPAT